MKFLCYASILCLSILCPVTIIAAEQQASTGTAAVEAPAPVVVAPAAVEPPATVPATAEELPGTAAAAEKPAPAPIVHQAAAPSDQDRQSVMTNLLSKLVNSYNELNAKYAELSAKYEKLQADVAAKEIKQNAQAEQPAAPQKTVEQPQQQESLSAEEVTSYAAAQELAQKMTAEKDKKASEPAEKPAAKSDLAKEAEQLPGTDNTSQYVKLKLNEDGREVEFMLDPMYVDMNFNFKRSSSTPAEVCKPEQAPQQQAQSPYQSAYQPQQPQVQQAPQQPQIQYVPYQLPQQPQFPQYQQQPQQQASQPAEKQPEEVQQKQPQQPQSAMSDAAGTRDVLDGIYRAQKYYYDRRYNDALRAVQNSLLAHETALGYALEGSIYYTLGDINSAVRSWRSALLLNPNMEDVRAAIDRYGR